MSTRIWTVDAFTDRPFAGNPAGVCLLESSRPDTWLQSVAAEMNLAETAFLLRRGPTEESGYHLRWFTPSVEVALCGHATLASAHFLWESGAHASPAIEFHTRSGVLRAEREGDAIRLDFPALRVDPSEPPAGMLGALGLATASFVGLSAPNYLVETDSAATVAAARPDFQRLLETTRPHQGVILTARADGAGIDFVSRYFAPAVGIDEDPATGSSHCSLAPYWSARLGKTEMAARQLSARGGALRVRLVGDRVHLIGRAVTMLRGEFQID